MKRSLLIFLVICAALIGLRLGYQSYYKSIRGFTLASITPSQFTYDPMWEIELLSAPDEEEIKNILKQPFTFIGKGGQAFAFESEDGRYVLKFLKFKYLRHNPVYQLISYIPFLEDYDLNEMQRKIKKFHNVYLGYHWAYKLNRKNSGLIYIHFNPTFNKFGSTELYDKLGTRHYIDLDQVVFVVQKKGRLLNEVLTEAFSKGDVISAQKKVLKIIEMYFDQYKKGLYDRDYGVVHNTGFVGEAPIHIDMGKMTYDLRMRQDSYLKSDILLVCSKIKEWIKKEHPKYYNEMALRIDEKCGL